MILKYVGVLYYQILKGTEAITSHVIPAFVHESNGFRNLIYPVL